MTIEALREEFNKLVKKKNFNYSDPEVVAKSIELEKRLFQKI